MSLKRCGWSIACVVSLWGLGCTPPPVAMDAGNDSGPADLGVDLVVPDLVDVPIMEAEAPCLDRDNDNHRDRACGGDDCDDNDPMRFPGQNETCNGKDDNCDGMTDPQPASDMECRQGGALRCREGSCERVEQVAAGPSFSCARMSTGHVKCWGDNTDGQLGNGTTDDSPTPVEVSNLGDATQIAVGNGFACALRRTGGVVCWGANGSGQLGNASFVSSNVPVAVRDVNDADEVTAGGRHACLRRKLDQGGLCWGDNNAGQLGNGSLMRSNVPVTVNNLGATTKISAGEESTCARRSDATVVCWGRNDLGQLGHGDTMQSSVAVTVMGLTDAQDVAVVFEHACARKANNTIVCWGSNAFGGLGNGMMEFVNPSPSVVQNVSDASQLGLGYEHSCARRMTGAIACWGKNTTGQLGDGSMNNTLVPVAVTGIADALQVSGGLNHSCALRPQSVVSCWGSNFAGSLGDGTMNSSTTPVRVQGL